MAAKKTLADLKKDMPQSSFHEKVAFQRENKNWLDKSFEISLTILDAIDEKGWNQTQLADKLGVSRQRVSKMLKGQENFQLSTLVKLEEVLGVEFVQVDGQDFTKKLNCYLTELTEQIVKSASVSKKRKSAFKDPAGYTTEFLHQTQKKVSDVGEAPFSYDLAA
ncbi:helix-turn-helix transcriptional regulator [Roseivirga spongicola]|uniref:HTH cro/C1-type domain-containing protein n=1 Tax=Roseivirga spongicola TaxID=333140 RepID=A0A150XAL4_9BACT|nr:helix-turn-helix transcriptional regulator [Roseivirga spongicola]KYG75720.1 hypothetical protein AWW68_07750 [Roseivirga spongicola]WPZ10717.1 helix-turn-helix transcriptional regulator [Roseivirga spongicola]